MKRARSWEAITLTLIALLTILALLSGCSVLEDRVDEARDFASRHPAITAIGSAVVGAGIAYAIEHHGHSHDDPFHRTGVAHQPPKARPLGSANSTTQPVDCVSNPYQCQ